MSHIFLNPYFLGALIICLMSGYILFYLLRIRMPSLATRHFTLSILFLFLLNAVYAVRFSLIGETGAYCRLATTGLVLLCLVHLGQFLIHYPREVSVKWSRFLLGFGWFSAIAMTAHYAYLTRNLSGIMYFEGHYYDFLLPQMGIIHSMLLFIFLMAAIVIALWRSWRLKGTDRKILLGYALILVGLFLLPTVLNILTVEGKMPRAIFQNTYTILTTSGIFVLAVFFINTTADETTLMSRIIGISLVAFLLIVQVISYFSIQATEKAFETKYFNAARLLAAGSESDIKPLRLSIIDLGSTKKSDFKGSNAMIFAAWRQGLSLRTAEHLLVSPVEKIWFAELFALRQNSLPNDTDFFTMLKKDILIISTKILPYLNNEHAPDWKKIIPEDNLLNFPQLRKILLSVIGLQNLMPRRVIDLLAPPTLFGEKYFAVTDQGNVVRFPWWDSQRSRLFEATYSYSDYRKEVHATVKSLAIISLIGFLTVCIIFPLFFNLTLMLPLKGLLAGVSRIRGGNLSDKVPVHGSDELSVLARTFNAMTSSIRDGQEALTRYASILEDKVRERTSRLEDSLTQVQQLKQQQDGDYFLTSLLLNPLGKNRVSSEGYSVDFFIKQKKQFDFKKWQAEIGGDICIADQIFLSDERYIVLLNADAMGKSIQGAGGAVVIGSVFHAIAERSRYPGKLGGGSPEVWLRSVFVELQRVFEVFDGSMLVSLFLGLIHEASGAFFYLNAEHPWPVLVREGRAEFLKQGIFLRKLGVIPHVDAFGWSNLREDSPLKIETFQLLPNDILLIGSDGRDDLLIAQPDPTEGRRINEDENIFRLVCERVKGDLHQIMTELTELGELVDDISLMRLVVRRDEKKTALTDEHLRVFLERYQAKEYQNALKLLEGQKYDGKSASLLAHTNYRLGDYNTAIRHALFAFGENPLRHDLLRLLAKAFARLEMFAECIHYAERFRIRFPSHISNLLLLAKVHLREGNQNTADFWAHMVLHYDKGNVTAQGLISRSV